MKTKKQLSNRLNLEAQPLHEWKVQFGVVVFENGKAVKEIEFDSEQAMWGYVTMFERYGHE